jgi:hypothetical protein
MQFFRPPVGSLLEGMGKKAVTSGTEDFASQRYVLPRSPPPGEGSIAAKNRH